MLETPLDKVEPYGVFKETLMSMSRSTPNKFVSIELTSFQIYKRSNPCSMTM